MLPHRAAQREGVDENEGGHFVSVCAKSMRAGIHVTKADASGPTTRSSSARSITRPLSARRAVICACRKCTSNVAGHKPHVHSTDQILVVTEGEGLLATDDERHEISAGDVASSRRTRSMARSKARQEHDALGHPRNGKDTIGEK